MIWTQIQTWLSCLKSKDTGLIQLITALPTIEAQQHPIDHRHGGMCRTGGPSD